MKKTPKYYRIGMYVDKDIYAAFSVRIKEEGLSLSSWIRREMKHYLKSQGTHE